MDNSITLADPESQALNKLPPPPTILQDDLPLQGSTTTTLSFESGIHPGHSFTMMDQPSVLTDTLSSFSSTHSSLLGGSNNNALSTLSSVTSSSSRRNSTQFARVEVKETLDASLSQNAEGFLQLAQYTLRSEIGKGAFGKVHFAIDEKTGMEYVSLFRVVSCLHSLTSNDQQLALSCPVFL